MDITFPALAHGSHVTSYQAQQSFEEESPESIQARFNEARATALPAHPTYYELAHVMWPSAREAPWFVHVFVPPPALSVDRAIIDNFSVYLYAQEGCCNLEEMYASALSFYRFNGRPRTSAPFRELYRLTDPDPWDTEDWAENVRWAKEQYNFYNSTTWLERDDHLDQITSWRLQSMWSSQEAIVQRVTNPI